MRTYLAAAASHRLRIAGCFLLLGTAAGANPAPPPEAFDRDASRAGFTVDLRMAGTVPGRFGAIDGELQPDADGGWRVSVQVDARALRLDGPQWMERVTRSPRFLDVAAHPRIRFESRSFPRALLRDGGELAGTLTLRGVHRDVVFRLVPAACDTPGYACEIRVRGEVDRRAFGMTAQRLLLRDTVGFEFHVRLRPPDATAGTPPTP